MNFKAHTFSVFKEVWQGLSFSFIFPGVLYLTISCNSASTIQKQTPSREDLAEVD